MILGVVIRRTNDSVDGLPQWLIPWQLKGALSFSLALEKKPYIFAWGLPHRLHRCSCYILLVFPEVMVLGKAGGKHGCFGTESPSGTHTDASWFLGCSSLGSHHSEEAAAKSLK